jgi:hypothetical protein
MLAGEMLDGLILKAVKGAWDYKIGDMGLD